MNLAEKLEQDGYTYRVFHNRPGSYRADRFVPDGKGGATMVTIYDAEGNFVANGLSSCSERDNFNKKLGMTIALGRAYCEMTGETQRRADRRLNPA